LTLQEQINEKSNASAFPYQSKKQPTRKNTKVSNKICKESTLQEEEVGGRSHHV
jgi:hypothetical protein